MQLLISHRISVSQYSPHVSRHSIFGMYRRIISLFYKNVPKKTKHIRSYVYNKNKNRTYLSDGNIIHSRTVYFVLISRLVLSKVKVIRDTICYNLVANCWIEISNQPRHEKYHVPIVASCTTYILFKSCHCVT